MELELESWNSDTWGNLLEFQQEWKGHRRALVGSSGIFSFTATMTVEAIIAGEHAWIAPVPNLVVYLSISTSSSCSFFGRGCVKVYLYSLADLYLAI